MILAIVIALNIKNNIIAIITCDCQDLNKLSKYTGKSREGNC